MKTGHKRQLAGGALGLMAGIGLVLRACLTGRWRVSLTALLTAAAVTAGTFHICGALAESREETAL